MKKYFFGVFLLLFFSWQVSEAAPTPWGLAINPDTKECAGYWAGDEFVDYKLPEGWKAYYPTHNPESRWGTIKTDVGECSFQIQKEEACCMELGYTFVSDNIGKGQKTILRDRDAFKKELEFQRKSRDDARWISVIRLVTPVILLIVFIGILFFVIWLTRKKRHSGNSNS